MEGSRHALRFPAFEDIVHDNRRHIESTGGLFVPPSNLLHPDSLLWVLDSIQHRVFGVDRFPTLAEKAAILAWVIIREHVFTDGCKRTGMGVLDTFLRANGLYLISSTQDIILVALAVADGLAGFSYGDFLRWVRRNVAPVASRSVSGSTDT